MSEAYIYGEIGEWNIGQVADAEVIHLNSYGGDVGSALAIYNNIKDKNVEIKVEGVCCSAATLICCGGKVKSAKNAIYMLHLPSVFLAGDYNETELAKVGESLDVVKSAVLETYKSKIAEDVEEMLKEETWLTAQQAKDLGLVDEIEGEVSSDITAEYVEMNCVRLKRGEYTQKMVLAYMNANKKQKVGNAAEKFAEIIKAQMQSGAEGLGGSYKMAEDKQAKAKRIAQFFV